uniref:Uncharacterized protein n=2 Tax=Daphnia magna TaxID=35525 RepID=A0A0P6G9I2_9CRUS
MDASRQSRRTRKVVNYVAMNGDRSDDSEDDIVNCVNVKLAVPTATVTKLSKLSKLKLGTRKAKLPKCDDTKLTKLKPILDDMEPTKLFMTSPCLTSNMEEIELSIAEPELTTHSIFSQETVITSSCECLSPHEFTDSSESDTYCSTVEIITPMNEDTKINTKCDPAILKTNEDRIIKRRIINENLGQQKKVKIDTEESKHQNTFSGYESSVSKPDVDVSPVPLQIYRLPTCLLGTDKASLENHVNISQQLAASSTSSFGAHEEVSTFQKNYVQSPVQPTNQLVKHNRSSEIECSLGAVSLNIIKTSDDSGSIIKSPMSALLTPKLTKSAIKEGCTSKVQATKNIVANLKLKRNSANLMKSRERSKNTSAPTVIDEQIIKASLSVMNDGDIAELNTSRNVTNPPHSVNILKPPSPQSRKLAVKWKPPGKAGGISTPLGGTSQAIGIRLGLSRNQRASKPLHPDVKVKI